MKIIRDKDIALVLTGADLPKELHLSNSEKDILNKAKIICEKADEYFEDENDFGWAEIYLKNIINDVHILN